MHYYLYPIVRSFDSRVVLSPEKLQKILVVNKGIFCLLTKSRIILHSVRLQQMHVHMTILRCVYKH